jgi:presenilin-like A22 family membrane protease
VILAGLAGDIVFVLNIAVILVGVYAFVHAAMQRSDAYTAAEKLTKPVWLVILGLGILLAAVLGGIFGAVICACAAGIYLVDVRPKLLEVQGKSR